MRLQERKNIGKVVLIPKLKEKDVSLLKVFFILFIYMGNMSHWPFGT